MTEEQKTMLKLLIVGTAGYYGQSIADDVLALYVEDLEDLPFDRVAEAIKDARRDPKTTRFPLPAIIRDRIAPAVTDENQATEAANRVIEAIGRYGWTNREQAIQFCGELAWRIVEADGGWERVCAALNAENMNTTRAQWKQLALATLRRYRAGVGDQAPALPSPAGDVMARIGYTPAALPGGERGGA